MQKLWSDWIVRIKIRATRILRTCLMPDSWWTYHFHFQLLSTDLYLCIYLLFLWPVKTGPPYHHRPWMLASQWCYWADQISSQHKHFIVVWDDRVLSHCNIVVLQYFYNTHIVYPWDWGVLFVSWKFVAYFCYWFAVCYVVLMTSWDRKDLCISWPFVRWIPLKKGPLMRSSIWFAPTLINPSMGDIHLVMPLFYMNILLELC